MLILKPLNNILENFIMKIVVNGNKAHIKGKFDIDKVERALTFTVPNYWFSPAYKKGYWDGKIRFLNGRTCPVGFLHRIQSIMPKAKIECDFPNPNINSLTEYVKKAEVHKYPREYQYEAIKVAVEKKLGIIKLATNAGKGRVIAGIVAAFPDVDFIILAHRKDIIGEIANECNKFLVTNNCEISTFQSAKNFDLSQFGGVLVDECASVAAQTFYNIVGGCENANIRVGFSATPERSDGKDYLIEAAVGQPIAEIGQQELVKRGISVKPKIYVVPFRASDFDGGYKNAEDMLINSSARNDIIAYLARGKKGVVILFRRIEHGKLIHGLIPNSYYVDGQTPQGMRDKIKQDFIDGKIDCLVSSNIFDTGVNLPNMTTLILAWAGKSPHGLVQKIGRAVRSHKGKTGVDIFCFGEQGNSYFDKHTKIRIGKLVDDGYDVEIWKG
jgi:superfamily II DNA or RNA helicase